MKTTKICYLAIFLGLLLAAAAVPAQTRRPPAQAVDAELTAALEAEVAGMRVPLPLLKTDMETWIDGDVATVVLRQQFQNPYAQTMHARYIFPLPQNAAVYAMRFETSREVVEAKIRKKEEAEQVFEEAKAEGKQAALLTQHRPNVFTQRIANLPGHDRITVEIRYAHTVPKRDGAYHYHFPMVVGPRYLPAGDQGQNEGEPRPIKMGQWNLPASPPLASPTQIDPERVGLIVHLDGGMPIQWVDSPSHVIDVHEPSPSKRLVGLASGRTIDNQDFELRYGLGGQNLTAGVTTWAKDGRGVLSLQIEPPAGKADPDRIQARELIFVLDCSGSMHGMPLDTSKRLMRQALKGLRPDDFFRIVRFSSAADEFSARPLSANKENIKKGIRYVEGLYGSGGTEMSSGIRVALDPAPVKNALRLVVFLTDGYVGNDMHVLRLVRERLGKARLFSLGIGNAVNRYLLEEMARAGRGVARFVRTDETPEQAADDLLRRLDAPFLTDLQIDWGQAPVIEPTPAKLPDLFWGQRLRVLASYTRAGSFKVILHGRLQGKSIQLPLQIDLPESAPHSQALDVLWARSLVHDRMLDMQSPEATIEEQDKLQTEITELGLKHKLVTQWTAFVAVAKQKVAAASSNTEADVAVAQVKDVSGLAYPQGGGSFGAAPEPAEWAALALLLGLAAWFMGRRQARQSS